MSLIEILQEVEKLSLAEKAKVAEALRHSESTENSHSVEERQNELNRRLLAEGLLIRIPSGNTGDREFKPINIKGKPLSETIIEERR